LQVGYIADEIGNTIKEHNAAGLLLSQVKRPDKNRPAEPPTLYDLKEAGEIENASEAVLIGHVEYQDIPGARSKLRTRKIKVEKNKDGPTFDDEWIDQDFDEYTASFRETQGRIYDDPQEELDLEPPELDDPRFL
jgi:replicative DNA helicase